MAATPPHVVLHEDADVIIEKDSLFSSEEPEEVVVEEVQEETSLDRLVDYSEEDINTLVSYVKSITTLYKLKPTDWTEENEDVIKTWFRDPSLPILCVFFSTDNLICTTGLPDGAIEIDLMYFLRETAQEFSVQTFHDNITFGTVDENIEGTLLNIIKDVFVPILLSTEKWPDRILFV